MRAALERCGYSICHRVIFSDEMAGVPQRRERLYIAAFRDADSAASFEWPAAMFNAHDHDDTAASGAGVDGGGEGSAAARPARRRCLTVREILETDGPAALLERHRLTAHQWEKVTSHRSWHTSVLPVHKRRLVNLDGCARTLGGKHSTCSCVFSCGCLHERSDRQIARVAQLCIAKDT